MNVVVFIFLTTVNTSRNNFFRLGNMINGYLTYFKPVNDYFNDTKRHHFHNFVRGNVRVQELLTVFTTNLLDKGSLDFFSFD